MAWLDARSADLVDQAQLTNFEYEGQRIPLMDRQRGIRKPAGMDAALSIRTVFTEPGATPPYKDQQGTDGLIRYKYRGDDPMHAENRALRRAYLPRRASSHLVRRRRSWSIPTSLPRLDRGRRAKAASVRHRGGRRPATDQARRRHRRRHQALHGETQQGKAPPAAVQGACALGIQISVRSLSAATRRAARRRAHHR